MTHIMPFAEKEKVDFKILLTDTDSFTSNGTFQILNLKTTTNSFRNFQKKQNL
jgi:hypothetical protein